MYLWIDLWDKRCGIAVYVERIVIPKEIISRNKLIDTIKKYIKNYSIKTIVVGLPFDLYGKDKKRLQKTEKFIENLKNIFPEQKIEWFDERFSTFEAENILNIMWKNPEIWTKDAISAIIILEDYLKKEKIY